MTRQELYDLVWQTPMIKLAKTYGLSDVGLRKICVKYNIPTPPLGYWAKRTHGKRVRQSPLPPRKTGESDTVHLVVHDIENVPVEVVQAQEAALAKDKAFPPIVVPEERPRKPHPVTAATSRSLRAANANYDGLKTGVEPGGVAVAVGNESIDRVVRIVDALAHAAEARGYTFQENPEGVRIVVDGVPISWRIHETKDKTPHVPTKEDLDRQARRDEDRKRYPNLYSRKNDIQAYASWDYSPSGRLSLTFTDATKYYWAGEGQVGNWRDRREVRLETHLDEAMRGLALAAISINRRLAEEAEQERLRQQEQARRDRERAREKRAVRRQEYILKKADDFDRYQRLIALTEHLERKVREYASQEPIDYLIDEARALAETLGECFARASMITEVGGLYAEDDMTVTEVDE